MMLPKDFYTEVIRIANDEVDRLNKLYNLTDLNKQQIYAQAVSAATILKYHSVLASELKKHNIDIGEITFPDDWQ